MKRNTLHFIIALVSLVVMWGLLTTGLLIKYIMPPGSGHWLALNGMNRHDWGDVHFWLAVTACVLVFVHTLLHWPWVCGTVRRFFATEDSNGHTRSRGWRMVWGVGLVAILVGGTAGFLAAANARVAAVEGAGDDRGGQGRSARLGVGVTQEQDRRTSTDRVDQHARDACLDESHEGGDGDHAGIRGSMTLAEVAAVKRLSVDELRRRLNLPADTPADERVGRLGRQHGFTVNDVRALAAGDGSGPATNDDRRRDGGRRRGNRS